MTDFSLFKTYGAGQPLQFNSPSDFYVGWQIYSEQWLDSLPQRLIDDGMTCQQARDYLTAHYDELMSRVIIKRDTVMAGFPSGIDFGFNGTGSPPDYGNWYIRETVPNDLDVVFVPTEFLAGLPDLATITIDGAWDTLAARTFASYPSTNPGSIPFNYSAWIATGQRVTSIDINKWFCNVTSCCGTGFPVGGGSQFLIPGPDMKEPVQENSSIPLIKTPVYLANHTWAFKNNFGRLPK